MIPKVEQKGREMKEFLVGVDSYSLGPLGLGPFELLDWAANSGADGVQFTDLNLAEGERIDKTFLEDLSRAARGRGLYLEWGGARHIPFDMTTWKPIDIEPSNRAAAEQAALLGTGIVRCCSGGLMRWSDSAPATEVLLRETAAALKHQRPMLLDLGVTLAIELHFEFTTFELLRLFEACDAEPGGYLGICLDTMNLFTMLEDPVMGTERILPWIVSTHAKDGAVILDDSGLVSFTVEAGAGQVDFERIIGLLAALDRPIHLSLEDHGGSFSIPIFDPHFLSRFPDLTVSELSRLIRLAREGGRRVREGTLAVLDREAWPRYCESRVRNGIQALKRIARDGR